MGYVSALFSKQVYALLNACAYTAYILKVE
jgi:hypothetical protein